jgi:hypothetical protein
MNRSLTGCLPFALILIMFSACSSDDPSSRADGAVADSTTDAARPDAALLDGPAHDSQANDGVDPDGIDGISAFAGFWLITSVTGQVGEVSLTAARDGTRYAVRGDVLIQVTGPTGATLRIRQVLLEDGVPMTPVVQREDTVATDGDRWLLTEQSGDVTVYVVGLDGDDLSLSWDPNDSRNARLTRPADEILATRASPWATTTAGTWQMNKPCYSDELSPVGTRVELSWTVTAALIGELTTRLYNYFNKDCSGTDPPPQVTQHTALLEEEGTTLRAWWQRQPTVSAARYDAYSFTILSNTMIMSRDDCAIKPGCESNNGLGGTWSRRP